MLYTSQVRDWPLSNPFQSVSFTYVGGMCTPSKKNTSAHVWTLVLYVMFVGKKYTGDNTLHQKNSYFDATNVNTQVNDFHL